MRDPSLIIRTLLGVVVVALLVTKNYEWALFLAFICVFYNYANLQNVIHPNKVERSIQELQKDYPQEFELEIPDLIQAQEIDLDEDETDTLKKEEPQKPSLPKNANKPIHYFFDINREYKRSPIKASKAPNIPHTRKGLSALPKDLPPEFIYPAKTLESVNQPLKANEKNNFFEIHNHNLQGISRFFSFVNKSAINKQLPNKDPKSHEARINDLSDTISHGLIVSAEGKNGIKQLNPPVCHQGKLITWEAKRTDMPNRLLGHTTKRIYDNAKPPRASLAIDFCHYSKKGLHS